MRLINTNTHELHEFFGDRIPDYAILSHTWSDREATFADWASQDTLGKDCKKILDTCRLARSQGYRYVWVDTNCIDKSSSAELSEAINSMFDWYKMAKVCYAYLVDVPSALQDEFRELFAKSRWFTRGWTLQELLAPREVQFYSNDWVLLGTKDSLCADISSITGIAQRYISEKLISSRYLSGGFVIQGVQHAAPIAEASVAERMSWISRRITTRAEDIAYCMLGIFDINMPLLYGEGPKAFIRLQEEIMKVSDDSSLFCWTRKFGLHMGFLSPSPSGFWNCHDLVPGQQELRPAPYFMTNAGLSMTIPILYCWSKHYFIGVLPVQSSTGHKNYGVPMAGDISSGKVCRTSYPPGPIPLSSNISTATRYGIFISENYSPIRLGQPQSVGYGDGEGYKKPLTPGVSEDWLLRDGVGPYCRSAALLTFELDCEVDFRTFPLDRFSTQKSIIEIFNIPTGHERENNPLRGEMFGSAFESVLVNLIFRPGVTESIMITSWKTATSWLWDTFWVPPDEALELQVGGEASPASAQALRAIQDGGYPKSLELKESSSLSVEISERNIELGLVSIVHMHFSISSPPHEQHSTS